MINLSHVYKTYAGPVHALRGINLEVSKGEFVFLTGPSGAGKTTLFKIITCYDIATSGDVIIGGTNYKKLDPATVAKVRRRLGVVFQDFKLLRDRSVFENISLPLEIAGASNQEISSRVKKVLDQVGLIEKARSWPEQLSGGEQQRVAIARAIVGRPGLLIADEPTGNLDQKLSRDVMDLFKTINSQGTTVLIATHNESLISSGRHRVIHLEKGQLIEKSNPKSQIREPEIPRVPILKEEFPS